MDNADRSHMCKGNASCQLRLNEKVFSTCSNVWARSNTDSETPIIFFVSDDFFLKYTGIKKIKAKQKTKVVRCCIPKS